MNNRRAPAPAELRELSDVQDQDRDKEPRQRRSPHGSSMQATQVRQAVPPTSADEDHVPLQSLLACCQAMALGHDPLVLPDEALVGIDRMPCALPCDSLASGAQDLRSRQCMSPPEDPNFPSVANVSEQARTIKTETRTPAK